MIFFFKKKPIVVDAFVSEKFSHVYEFSKIDHAKKFLPQWWKDMSTPEFDFASMQRKQTAKTCRGIIDHYLHGFMIPLWADLAIKFTDRPAAKFSDNVSTVSLHPPELRNNIYPDCINLKIHSPWLLKSKKDLYFNYLPAFYNKTKYTSWEVLPGTVDFYYQHGSHINLFIPNQPFESMIEFGTPIAHIVPLTEEEVSIKCHLISNIEWESLNGVSSNEISFTKKYLNMKRATELVSKCPFHRS